MLRWTAAAKLQVAPRRDRYYRLKLHRPNEPISSGCSGGPLAYFCWTRTASRPWREGEMDSEATPVLVLPTVRRYRRPMQAIGISSWR